MTECFYQHILSPLEEYAQNLVGPAYVLSRGGLWIANLGGDDLNASFLSFILLGGRGGKESGPQPIWHQGTSASMII